MSENKIPTRAEVAPELTWNLKDMFESDEAWLAEYEVLKSYPEKISAMAGTLGASAENLLAYFKLEDEIELRLGMFYGYASCISDGDTGNNFYQDFRGKATATYVAISSAAAFSTPEIMAISDETLDSFYAQCPELETYRRVLYRIRRRAEHILSPAEEKLLAAAGEMADAPD
ncbi:MAG: oligoendopeptidase F, partial [Clostridia bacterium]|nr:oligoendopeptidase F [Clostridia bacterium]